MQPVRNMANVAANVSADYSKKDESSVFANNKNFFDDDAPDDEEVFVRKAAGSNSTLGRSRSRETASQNAAAQFPKPTGSRNFNTRQPSGTDFGHAVATQHVKVEEQDKHIAELGATISELREISENISVEVDEQVLLLDDFGEAMEGHRTRLQRVMNRIEKLSRLSSDKQQWVAIFVLAIALTMVLVLFVVL